MFGSVLAASANTKKSWWTGAARETPAAAQPDLLPPARALVDKLLGLALQEETAAQRALGNADVLRHVLEKAARDESALLAFATLRSAALVCKAWSQVVCDDVSDSLWEAGIRSDRAKWGVRRQGMLKTCPVHWCLRECGFRTVCVRTCLSRDQRFVIGGYDYEFRNVPPYTPLGDLVRQALQQTSVHYGGAFLRRHGLPGGLRDAERPVWHGPPRRRGEAGSTKAGLELRRGDPAALVEAVADSKFCEIDLGALFDPKSTLYQKNSQMQETCAAFQLTKSVEEGVRDGFLVQETGTLLVTAIVNSSVLQVSSGDLFAVHRLLMHGIDGLKTRTPPPLRGGYRNEPVEGVSLVQRLCFLSHKVPEPPPKTSINIRILDVDQTEVFFKVRFTTEFIKVFRAFVQRVGVALEDRIFLYDGELVTGDATPDALEMEDGDHLIAMMPGDIDPRDVALRDAAAHGMPMPGQ